MVVLGNPMVQAPFNFNKNGWINGAFRSKHDNSILATQECLIFIYLVTNFNINLLIEFLATMFLALTFTLGNEGPTTQLGFVLGNPMVEVGFNLKKMLGYDIVESMVPSNLKFDNWISTYIMMWNVHKLLMSCELQ
jgi:hypothetical protein